MYTFYVYKTNFFAVYGRPVQRQCHSNARIACVAFRPIACFPQLIPESSQCFSSLNSDVRKSTWIGKITLCGRYFHHLLLCFIIRPCRSTANCSGSCGHVYLISRRSCVEKKSSGLHRESGKRRQCVTKE